METGAKRAVGTRVAKGPGAPRPRPLRAKSKNNATNARFAGIPSDMKTKILLFAAALAGGVLTASAYTPAQNASGEVAQLAAPVVTKVVNPEGLMRRHEGATVRVTLTVDETGKPSDIRLLHSADRNLKQALIPALSQWEFAPARLNGKAISTKVELPIQLLRDSNS